MAREVSGGQRRMTTLGIVASVAAAFVVIAIAVRV